MPQEHIDLNLDELDKPKVVQIKGEKIEVAVPTMEQVMQLETVTDLPPKEQVEKANELITSLAPALVEKKVKLNAAQFAKLIQLIVGMVNEDDEKKDEQEGQD